MNCRENVSLGAYVLGALEPAERAAVERHLPGCPSCRDEVVSFAPLPGLLRHTPFEELPEVHGPAAWDVPPGPPDAPDAPDAYGPAGPAGPHRGRGEPPSATFRPRRAGPATGAGRSPSPGHDGPGVPEPEGRPRTSGGGSGGARGRAAGAWRRRRVLAAAAVFLAACASAVFLLLGPASQDGSRQDGPAPAATVKGTDPDTMVSASAALTPRSWGTEVELRLSGLPDDVRCVMVVHGRGGLKETGGAWASGFSGGSTVPASTSVDEHDITRIDILSSDGVLLVSLPRTAGPDGAGT